MLVAEGQHEEHPRHDRDYAGTLVRRRAERIRKPWPRRRRHRLLRRQNARFQLKPAPAVQHEQLHPRPRCRERPQPEHEDRGEAAGGRQAEGEGPPRLEELRGLALGEGERVAASAGVVGRGGREPEEGGLVAADAAVGAAERKRGIEGVVGGETCGPCEGDFTRQ